MLLGVSGAWWFEHFSGIAFFLPTAEGGSGSGFFLRESFCVLERRSRYVSKKIAVAEGRRA